MLKQEEKEALQDALKETSRRIEQDLPLNLGEFSNEDLEHMYSAAYQYYQANDFEKAQVLFHQLVISKPFKKDYWLGLGSCLQLKRSYDEALQAWGMASILDGHDPMPHFHAAECSFAKEDFEQAHEALNAMRNLLTPAHEELKSQATELEKKLNEKRN